MRNVLNALRALEEIATRQPIGVGELARAMDLPKSTLQRTLHTLHEAGWIRPADGAGTRWVITGRALYVGRRATGDLGLRDAAVPVMEQLRRDTGETVHLTVPEGDAAVLVERLETAQPVRIVLPLGTRLPLHASANGKAYLAALPAERAGQLLDAALSELPGYTGTTITSRSGLLDELAAVRERGWSDNRGEWRADVCAVAAPVRDASGAPVASLSVNVPASRMTPEARSAHGPRVRDAARQLSGVLGHVES
ncbi:IclR family transcriptional regulator [Streptomyces sp. NPDC054796]